MLFTAPALVLGLEPDFFLRCTFSTVASPPVKLRDQNAADAPKGLVPVHPRPPSSKTRSHPCQVKQYCRGLCGGDPMELPDRRCLSRCEGFDERAYPPARQQTHPIQARRAPQLGRRAALCYQLDARRSALLRQAEGDIRTQPAIGLARCR